MKKFISCLMLLLCMCMLFSGCSKTNLTMPEDYTNVGSNGGFVVSAGNQLYFANAYKSYTSVTKKSHNKGSGVKQHFLNRIEFDLVNSSEKKLKVDEEENLISEKVANKIAGYEKSNMFVVGKYLYFTTPSIHKNDSKNDEEYGKLQSERLSFYRVKLDGTGLKELFTTKSETAEFYLTGEANKRLFVFDDGKIKVMNIGKGETSLSTVAKNVKQVAFPNNQEQNFVNLYYTVERDDAFTGDKLKKYNLVTGETEDVAGYSRNKEKLNLIAFDGINLFYTRTGGDVEALYSNDFSNDSSEILQKYYIKNFTTDSVILTINEEEYDANYFIYEYNNNIYAQDMETGNDQGYKQLTTGTCKIAFVDGTYVYYTTADGIYRVSVLDENLTVQTVSNVKDFDQNYIDFDGRYVYFFAKAENGTTDTKYLYRADTSNVDSDIIVTECIALLADGEIAEEE